MMGSISLSAAQRWRSRSINPEPQRRAPVKYLEAVTFLRRASAHRDSGLTTGGNAEKARPSNRLREK